MRSKAEEWAATKGQIMVEYEKDRPHYYRDLSMARVTNHGNLEIGESHWMRHEAIGLARWILETFDES